MRAIPCSLSIRIISKSLSTSWTVREEVGSSSTITWEL